MKDWEAPSVKELATQLEELTQDEIDELMGDGELESISKQVWAIAKTASSPSIAMTAIADVITNICVAVKNGDEAAPIQFFRLLANTIEADLQVHGHKPTIN